MNLGGYRVNQDLPCESCDATFPSIHDSSTPTSRLGRSPIGFDRHASPEPSEPSLRIRLGKRFGITRTRSVSNALNLNVLPSRPTQKFFGPVGIAWIPDHEACWRCPLQVYKFWSISNFEDRASEDSAPERIKQRRLAAPYLSETVKGIGGTTIDFADCGDPISIRCVHRGEVIPSTHHARH